MQVEVYIVQQAALALNAWSVRHARAYINHVQTTITLHTYLDGISPLTYLGLWAVGVFHSTATLSSEETYGLYGLRLMHRLNIFLSCFGPRAGQAIFFLAPKWS